MDIMSYLLGQNSGGAKKGLKVIVVDELPTTGEADILYLVPKQDTGDNDIFEEWLWIEEDWEKIGTTDIDLSNYYTKGETLDITGLLANLQTTSKTNLVSAINELAGNSSPIGVIEEDFGAPQNISKTSFDNNATLKSKSKGIYILKTKNTTANYDGVVGLFVSNEYVSSNITWQSQYLMVIAGGGSNKFVMSRQLKEHNTYSPYYYNFSSNFIELYGSNVTMQSGGTRAAKVGDIASWYGTKTISNLTTTTKTSLVDAINEVNTKINNLVDANNTSY